MKIRAFSKLFRKVSLTLPLIASASFSSCVTKPRKLNSLQAIIDTYRFLTIEDHNAIVSKSYEVINEQVSNREFIDFIISYFGLQKNHFNDVGLQSGQVIFNLDNKLAEKVISFIGSDRSIQIVYRLEYIRPDPVSAFVNSEDLYNHLLNYAIASEYLFDYWHKISKIFDSFEISSPFHLMNLDSFKLLIKSVSRNQLTFTKILLSHISNFFFNLEQENFDAYQEVMEMNNYNDSLGIMNFYNLFAILLDVNLLSSSYKLSKQTYEKINFLVIAIRPVINPGLGNVHLGFNGRINLKIPLSFEPSGNYFDGYLD